MLTRVTKFSLCKAIPICSRDYSILNRQTCRPCSTRLIKNFDKKMFSGKKNLFTISSSIVEASKNHEIFPDVIKEFSPKGLLSISYSPDVLVVMGNTLKVSETQTKPAIQFTLDNSSSNDSQNQSAGDVRAFSPDNYFTLVMTDPDAPSRTDKKWSEYAHYIKTNVKLIKKDSDDFLAAELDLSESSGPDYLKYEGPGPPPKTGKHRYVFLLFEQGSKKINPEPLKGRPNWGTGIPASGVQNWAQKLGLEPIAVNFFYAENEQQ